MHRAALKSFYAVVVIDGDDSLNLGVEDMGLKAYDLSEDSPVTAASHHAVHARLILTGGEEERVQIAARSLFYYLLTDYNCLLSALSAVPPTDGS